MSRHGTKSRWDRKSLSSGSSPLFDVQALDVPAASLAPVVSTAARREAAEALASKLLADDQEPETCSTGSSSSQGGQNQGYVLIPGMPIFSSVPRGGLQPGGEDKTEQRIEGSWCPTKGREFLATLRRAKEAAGRKRESGAVELPEDGSALVVQANDKSDRGGFKWNFICRWMGCLIFIRDSVIVPEGQPAVKFELGSEFLMQHGGDGAVAIMFELLRSLGFRRGGDQISRVDVCADVGGVDPLDLVAAAMSGKRIGKGRRDGSGYFHPDPITGEALWHSFSWGTGGSISIRIYDKAREVAKAKAAGKEALLRERWGIAADVPIEQIQGVRVEFQLRGKALREMGISSWEQWQKRRAGAVAWLTSEWFRIAAEEPDRANKHQARCMEFHPLWARVVECFAQWLGRVGEKIERPAKKPAKIKRLVQSGMGYLTAIMARSSVAVTSVQEGVEFVVRFFEAELERIDRSLLGEVSRKRDDYIAATGAVVIDPGDIPF